MTWIGMEDHTRLTAVDHGRHALRLHEDGVEGQLAKGRPSVSTADYSSAVALAGACESSFLGGFQAPFPPAMTNKPLLNALTAAIE